MATIAFCMGTWTTTNNTDRSTSAIPAVNDLLVLVLAFSGWNGTGVLVTDNQGGTWTKITGSDFTWAGGVNNGAAYVRNQLVTSAVSHTITLDCTTNSVSHSGGGFCCAKVTGVTRTGSSAIKQVAVELDMPSSGTPAPVFGSAPDTNNCIFGCVANQSNPATLTQRTSFTEFMDNGYNNPATGLEGMGRSSGETATTQTWGSTSATNYGSIVIEIDTSAAAAASLTPYDPLLNIRGLLAR